MIDVVGNFFAYWYGCLEKIPYFCDALSINRSMQLIHRIAHLLSRLLAVGSAYIYIYIYIYISGGYAVLLQQQLEYGLRLYQPLGTRGPPASSYAQKLHAAPYSMG